jgi:hypothetical protein
MDFARPPCCSFTFCVKLRDRSCILYKLHYHSKFQDPVLSAFSIVRTSDVCTAAMMAFVLGNKKAQTWVLPLVVVDCGSTSLMKMSAGTRIGSRGSLVSILADTGWTTGVRSPTDAEYFSSRLCVHTGFVAHPASCSVGTGGPFPRGKARPGHDADHSPPSSAEVKNE